MLDELLEVDRRETRDAHDGLPVGTIVSGAPTRVKVVAAIVAALLTAGCFWRNFDERLILHTELLRDEARKGVDVAVAGRFTAEGLAELLYPLSRAQAFAREAHRRLGARAVPAGLRELDKLLVAYTALCDAVDRARRTHAGPVPREVLDRALGRVERSAARLLGRHPARAG